MGEPNGDKMSFRMMILIMIQTVKKSKKRKRRNKKLKNPREKIQGPKIFRKFLRPETKQTTTS